MGAGQAERAEGARCATELKAAQARVQELQRELESARETAMAQQEKGGERGGATTEGINTETQLEEAHERLERYKDLYDELKMR